TVSHLGAGVPGARATDPLVELSRRRFGSPASASAPGTGAGVLARGDLALRAAARGYRQARGTDLEARGPRARPSLDEADRRRANQPCADGPSARPAAPRRRDGVPSLDGGRTRRLPGAHRALAAVSPRAATARCVSRGRGCGTPTRGVGRRARTGSERRAP